MPKALVSSQSCTFPSRTTCKCHVGGRERGGPGHRKRRCPPPSSPHLRWARADAQQSGWRAHRHSQVQRRVAMLSVRVRVGPVGQQHHDTVVALTHHRHVQGCVPRGAGAVHVAASFQQHAGHLWRQGAGPSQWRARSSCGLRHRGSATSSEAFGCWASGELQRWKSAGGRPQLWGWPSTLAPTPSAPPELGDKELKMCQLF